MFSKEVFVCETILFDHPEASHVENLEERCSREFGFVSNDCLVDEAGSYCVIATVWPCRKVKFLVLYLIKSFSIQTC